MQAAACVEVMNAAGYLLNQFTQSPRDTIVGPLEGLACLARWNRRDWRIISQLNLSPVAARPDVRAYRTKVRRIAPGLLLNTGIGTVARADQLSSPPVRARHEMAHNTTS